MITFNIWGITGYKYVEMIKWCKENLVGKYELVYSGRRARYGLVTNVMLCKFENEEEALLFKLTWS